MNISKNTVLEFHNNDSKDMETTRKMLIHIQQMVKLTIRELFNNLQGNFTRNKIGLIT